MNKTNECEVVNKLKEMRLSAMSLEYAKQKADVNIDLKTFEERFCDIVDSEWLSRYNKKLNKFRKQAELRISNAFYEDIIYKEERNLDRNLMERLLELNWLKENKDLIITGACGCGKTYIACALGNLACESFLNVKYYRTQMLLTQLKESRLNETYLKMMRALSKIDLLILDDFGLMELNSEQCMDLFEIIEAGI